MTVATLTLKAADGAINTLNVTLPFTTVPPLTSRIVVPGHTVVGYYLSSNLDTTPAGSKIGLKKFYCDGSTSSTGNPDKIANLTGACAAGYDIHVSLTYGLFGSNSAPAGAIAAQPASTNPLGSSHGQWWGCDDVIAKNCDAVLAMWAKCFKNLNVLYPNTNFIVDWGHEGDTKAKISNDKFGVSQQALMQQYSMDYFTNAGLKNIEYAWVVVGYFAQESASTIFSTTDGNLTWSQVFNGMYKGLDTRTTHIQNDPYLTAADQTVQNKLLVFYNWVAGGGLGPVAAKKPFGFGEVGIGTPGTDAASIATRKSLFQTLVQLKGKIAIAEYWDDSIGSGWNDYTLGANEADFAAVTQLL